MIVIKKILNKRIEFPNTLSYYLGNKVFREKNMDEVLLRYQDDYPESCPPKDAYPPKDLLLYRICKSTIDSSDLIAEDFIPVWEDKDRKFPSPKEECSAKALSFNSNLNALKRLIKNHPNIGNRIVKFELNESCGLIKETGKNHFNLWDFMQPDILKAIQSNWEEVSYNE